MKKLLIILLTVLLLLSLTACSGIEFIKSSPNPESRIELVGNPQIKITASSNITNYSDIHITGTCQNNSNYDYTSVTLEFDIYNKDGKLVAVAFARTKGLEKGSKWDFAADFNTISQKDAVTIDSYVLKEIIASKKSDITQEELDEQIRSAGVKADFVEINAGNWENKRVYIEGTVSGLDTSDSIFNTFLLGAKEGSGYGVYMISASPTMPNCSKALEVLKNGDTVKVYGTVNGRDKDIGAPFIFVNIIEIK